MKSISSKLTDTNRSTLLKSFLPHLSYRDLLALVILTMAGILLFAKNIFVENAVVFQDEYGYKINADRQIEPEKFLERNLAVQMPNQLFFALYGFGSYFDSNYYVFAQFLNVIWWGLGIFILYRLAILSGLSEKASLIYLGIVILLPLSAYTKYFMPESMYFFLVCLTIYLFFIGVLRQNYMALVLSGVIVGLTYYVKPHAVFVVIPSIAFLLLLKGADRWKFTLSYTMGAAFSVIVGKNFLFKISCSSPYLCAYGGATESLLGVLKTYPGGFGALASNLLHVSMGHFTFLFSVFGLAILVALAIAVPQLHFLGNGVVISQPIQFISRYNLILTIFVVCVSILFTVLAGETSRIHSRYYFFIFPLLLLILFHFPALRLSRAGIIVGWILCFTSIVLLVSVGRNYSAILSLSLVSDSPELGFVFVPKFVFYFSVLLLAFATSYVIVYPTKFWWLVGVITLLSLISSADVMAKQRGIFRGLYTTGREAIAVEQAIGKEQMDNAVIVGENYDIMTKFLFFLSSAPNIDYLGSGNNVESSLEKYPNSKWLVTISNGYRFPKELKCSPLGATITICSVAQ